MVSIFKSFVRETQTSDENLSSRDFINRLTEEDLIIDVRTPYEYAEHHIRGAANYDMSSVDFINRVDKLDRERTYYLYCRSGNRSGYATKMMCGMGFDEVYNIGGIGELQRAGIDIERG